VKRGVEDLEGQKTTHKPSILKYEEQPESQETGRDISWADSSTKPNKNTGLQENKGKIETQGLPAGSSKAAGVAFTSASLLAPKNPETLEIAINSHESISEAKFELAQPLSSDGSRLRDHDEKPQILQSKDSAINGGMNKLENKQNLCLQAPRSLQSTVPTNSHASRLAMHNKEAQHAEDTRSLTAKYEDFANGTFNGAKVANQRAQALGQQPQAHNQQPPKVFASKSVQTEESYAPSGAAAKSR
jgi:hypothetical protein